MTKDSRLSFRISSTLSKRIESAINETPEKFKDRSEFGTKAVEFFLDYIENFYAEQDLLIESILALADETGVDTDQIKYIENLEEKSHIPNKKFGKPIEEHPRYDELLGLVSEVDKEVRDQLQIEIDLANYQDVDNLIEKYS